MEVLTQTSSTVDPAHRGKVHRYALTRDLDETYAGVRHLVLDVENHTSHLLQRLNRLFPDPKKPGVRVRFERAMSAVQSVDNPHILRVDEYGWDEELGPFTISDYTGDADGVVTLERLITLKGGSLTLEESKRALEQLMSACAAAHATLGEEGVSGLAHGTLSMRQVQVDRRGSLLIELYGLQQQLNPSLSAPGDEVRSIAAIGYQLATGLLPLKPLIPIEHVIEHIDATWRDYLQTALEEGGPGFTSAAHALAAVHGLRIAGGIGDVGTSLRDLIRSMLTPVR